MENKKTFTLQELADEYNVSVRTVYTWLQPIREKVMSMNPVNKKRIRILLPKQVKFIKEFLG
ncbi:MAG: HTH domain-containing protein [Bacteroidota bacterium]